MNLPSLPLLGLTFLLGLLVNPSTVHAATVIQDDFNDGNPTTGATTLPVSSWSKSGNSVESDGVLTITTNAIGGSAAPTQWSGSVLYTNTASSQLNLYQNSITVAIRELTLSSSGDHAGTQARFRFGLMPRDNEAYINPAQGTASNGTNTFGQFYNSGNDGISVDITNNADLTSSVFTVRYKKNASTSATDPNNIPTNGSATVGFIVTGLDFTATSTEWTLTLYGDNSATSVHSGTWSLGDMGSWGNATDGWGNSSFIMGVQNMGAAGLSEPTASANGWTTATIGSVSVTAVPEPSRALLAFGGLLLLATRRQR
jgi:hypothetical protein